MNFKALAAVVALVALQALCAEAASLPDDPQQDLDIPENEQLALDAELLLNSLDDGGKLSLATQGKLGVSTQSVDNLLRAFQALLNQVDRALTGAYNAVQAAVANALRVAQNVTDDTVSRWNQALQNIIDRNELLNATLTECRARNPSLQSVADELGQDVQTCAQAVAANATQALSQLQDLRDEARQLSLDAQTAVNSCRNQGWVERILCVLNQLPLLTSSAVTLAGDATATAARITGTFVINIPINSAACVGGAVSRRSVEANAIVREVRSCVDAALASATSTTTSTTAAP